MDDLTALDAIVERVRGSPLAMAKLARTLLLEKGQDARARELCREALALKPDDGELRVVAAEVQSRDVAAWYFSMVRDERRHDAYARAFARALSNGGRVLDIGAGTGLFAMMAARAGADEVIACESNPVVAEAARAVVAANGLQDRVRIVQKASKDLEVGVDMDGPADVLIWDNLANDMIGAGALPVLEDASRRLMKAGAAVIPAAGTVKAALVEDRSIVQRRMQAAAGFDLTAFNRLAKPSYTQDCASPDVVLRSPPTTLFAFDFRSGGPFAADAVSAPVASTGGRVDGVVQWLEFDLDGHERYDTAPGADVWAFGLLVYPAPRPFETAEGEGFVIGAAHDRQFVRVWLEGGR
jgi:predicted nicotinamide N-methyase